MTSSGAQPLAASPDPPVQPVPAATIVLLRPSAEGVEVLLGRRPPTMAFAAGIDVFPGGRVDAADGDPRLAALSVRGRDEAAAALGGNVSPDEAMAAHMAAIRELLEEAGVLLAAGQVVPEDAERVRAQLLGGVGLVDALSGLNAVRIATDRLVPIARWTTPPFMPRRFATWFFVADLPPGAEPSLRGDEVASHRWITPAAALDEVAGGASRMWVPTTSVLQRLVAAGARHAADVARRVSIGWAAPPRVEVANADEVRLAFGSAGALPGATVTTRILGRRRMIVVDPGDPSQDAIEAITGVVSHRDGAIEAIVLTGADPAHAAGAEAIAIPLEIPILVAPGAGRHLPYVTRELGEDEALPSDVDLRVRLGPPGSGRLAVVGPTSAGE